MIQLPAENVAWYTKLHKSFALSNSIRLFACLISVRGVFPFSFFIVDDCMNGHRERR